MGENQNGCCASPENRPRSGINFTNILQAVFSSQSVLHSISVFTVRVCNIWAKGNPKKAVCKMLVKLTTDRLGPAPFLPKTRDSCEDKRVYNLDPGAENPR